MVEIMKRTRAEQKLDDDEAVRGNLRDMGPWGALQFVIDQLASGTQPSQHKRRMLILTGAHYVSTRCQRCGKFCGRLGLEVQRNRRRSSHGQAGVLLLDRV
jgi:hypothetical protein